MKTINVGQIVYKKVLVGSGYKDVRCDCHTECTYTKQVNICAIVTLEVLEAGFIPEVDNCFEKGRVAAAKVLDIEYIDGAEGDAYSSYDNSFKYNIGEVVRPEYAFDSTPYETCVSGIHCFETREQALEYQL